MTKLRLLPNCARVPVLRPTRSLLVSWTLPYTLVPGPLHLLDFPHDYFLLLGVLCWLPFLLSDLQQSTIPQSSVLCYWLISQYSLSLGICLHSVTTTAICLLIPSNVCFKLTCVLRSDLPGSPISRDILFIDMSHHPKYNISNTKVLTFFNFSILSISATIFIYSSSQLEVFWEGGPQRFNVENQRIVHSFPFHECSKFILC